MPTHPSIQTKINVLYWGGLLCLIVSSLTLAQSGSPPQITEIQFKPEILADGQLNKGLLFFKAPDSEVTKVEFSVIEGNASNLKMEPGFSFNVDRPNVTDGFIEFKIAATSAGSYRMRATLEDRAGNHSQPKEFSFVAKAVEVRPRLQVFPTSLNFRGEDGGLPVVAQSLTITNLEGGTLSWMATTDAGWLRVSPSSGTTSATASVSVDIANLRVGNYEAKITINASGAQNSPIVVSVNLQLIPRLETSLIGHNDVVFSVAFSPNGLLLASGSLDNTIKLWEVATGREIRTLRGHTDGIRSVAFSPDGKLLASGSQDKTVKLWELATGREIRTLQGHGDFITQVAFSPDGRLLASASQDETVKLWEVTTGREVRTLQGHTNNVWSVAFSPDGKLLASGSGDNTIKLWEVATGREARTLQGHTDWVRSVAFSPDGKLLASGSDDKTVKLWELATGREIRSLSGHMDFVNSAAFSQDGRLVASGSRDTKVKLWEVATGRELRTLVEHTDWIWSVAFSPDGKLLASGSADTRIILRGIGDLTGR